MKVGIHEPFPGKKDSVTDVYRKILMENGIDFIDLDSSALDFWQEIKEVTHFIYRWGLTDYHHQHGKTIMPIIEEQLKIPCFPNIATTWHYDDKVKQSLLLASNNYPAVNFFAFWDKLKALEWLQVAELPLVFKLKSGSGSKQVLLVKNKKDAKRLINKMFTSGYPTDYYGLLNAFKTSNFSLTETAKHIAVVYKNRYFSRIRPWWARQNGYVYFQEFLPGNKYDTRVQITGNRAFAFIRHNRKNDFRASGSNNWDMSHDKIDMVMVKIAFEVSKKFGFQSMAYDFIYDKNKKPAIVEISYGFGDYPEFSNGYWDDKLVWHKGRFVPQYFDLVDLLNKPDLIMPEDVSAQSKYSFVS